MREFWSLLISLTILGIIIYVQIRNQEVWSYSGPLKKEDHPYAYRILIGMESILFGIVLISIIDMFR